MPARFFCKTGAFAGSSFEIGEEATIGRRASEAITLASDVISGQHARIFRDGEHYVLEDLGSSNGTRVDSVEVHTPIRLGRLHVVTFADQIDFIFQELPAGGISAQQADPTVMHTAAEDGFASVPLPSIDREAEAEHTHLAEAFTPIPTLSDDAVETPPLGAPSDPAEEHASDEDSALRTHMGAAFAPMPDLVSDDPPTVDLSSAEPPAAEPPTEPAVLEEVQPTADSDDATIFRPAFASQSERAGSPFVLEVQRVGVAAETFSLDEGEHVIGRARECDITLDDHSVSRRHAVLIVRDGAVTVRDLGSKNRTRLNGQEIADETPVPPGGVLRFGLQVEAVLARA